MANIGEIATSTLRARQAYMTNAISDNQPIFKMMKEAGGKMYEDGGRDIVVEAAMKQNSTVVFGPERGTVSLANQEVLDAAYYDWTYLFGSLVITEKERLINRGKHKILDLLKAKVTALEETSLNVLHAALFGDGTTAYYPNGLANLVSTTPTSGTVGGMDRSVTANAWIRNQAATTTTAVSASAMTASNALKCLDYMIDKITRNSENSKDNILPSMSTLGFLAGQTHFSFISDAINSRQTIVNQSKTGEAGFQELVYRGIKIWNGAGLSFSGGTQATATRTYLLNFAPGGVNLKFMRGAEFETLAPVASADQLITSRIQFSMLNFVIGGLAKTCFVVYDS